MIIAMFILAYLLGSIPTAVWVSKYLFGQDIRTQGSGNAGSTNMFRIHGKTAGILTQVVDILKGSLAAALPLLANAMAWDMGAFLSGASTQTLCLACGLLAVVGHIYPIFAGFKGGKGINTLLGMVLVVDPLAALISIVVFIVVLLLSKYVSMGSMLATLAFPAFLLTRALASGSAIDVPLVVLGMGMFLLVVFTHRANVQRLINGVENKAGFLVRKK